eukprot:g2407.t1
MQPPLSEADPTTSQAVGNGVKSKGITHPISITFHFLFKVVAMLYFLLCKSVFDVHDFITNFIVILVFLSCDFWVVKNVTGRYLVGLRWWNDNTSDGESWRFEHLESDQREIRSSEKITFWSGLVGNLCIWFILTFVTLIKPSNWEYLLICVIAIVMGGSNFYGYFKCSKEARQFVKEQATRVIISATESGINTTTAASVAANRSGQAV